MDHKDTSPEEVVKELRALLGSIVSDTVPRILVTAGDEMGGEFDEAVKFIEHGVRQAMRVLAKQ